jgi:GLPGLI family protein
MNRKSLFNTLMILLINNIVWGQNTNFIKSGTIEYDKSTNMYVLIKKKIGSNDIAQQALEKYKNTQPRFKVLKSILVFDENKTLFTPILTDAAPNGLFYVPFAEQYGIVYSDRKSDSCISQKNYLDETFLIKDSIRKINWKITDETREIAGYLCRRANAIILDSIYVVAFYSSEIKASGGPEFFSGLPGMILGIALPHENITWFATKVTIRTSTEPISPPIKGKLINNEQLLETLKGIKDNNFNGLGINKIVMF